MKTRLVTKASLLASTLLPAMLVTVPAQAQDDTSVINDTITVTARRREESLQDVPLSVSAFTGAQLEELGTPDITGLAEVLPNVTLEASRGTNSTLSAFIRGVGQQDPVAGFESGVGIYIDDVYLNRPQGAVLDIFDVERIEVLRGPQGTLYGRNTIGGAVKFVTSRLDPENPTLNFRANYGSYGQIDQIVSGSTPLGDQIRVGGAVANLSRDGFGENLLTGEDNYNKDVLGLRVSAEVEPTDNLFFRVSYDRTEDDSNPRHGHRLIPGVLSGAPVLDDVFNTRAGLSVPQQSVEAEGYSILAEWTINDNWTVKNIFAEREDDTSSPIDFDSLPSGDLDVPVIYTNEQLTEEFQVLYTGDKLAGVMGFFYMDANAFNVFDVLLDNVRPGLNAQTLGDVDTETWSLFANFTYDLTDELSLTLGGRYTEDERSSRVLRRTYFDGFSEFFGGTASTFLTSSDFDDSNSWDDFSPTVSLAWQPDAANNYYVTFSQGFKGGGFDPRGQTTAAPDLDGDGVGLTTNGTVDPDDVFEFMSFEPEYVDSYEIGWKYASSTYQHSLAVFYMDYQDVQVPGSVGVDTDGDGVSDSFTGVTTNAGAATIKGIEYEGLAQLGDSLFNDGDSLSMNWAVGILDGEYDEFINAFGVDVSDDVVIQNTPDYTASVQLSYATPAFGGDLAINNTLSLRGDSSQFEFPFAELDQGSYALWNASVLWYSTDGHWELGLHGRNLTDEEYRVSGYDFVNNDTLAPELGLEGTLTAFYGAPRTVTATVAWRY